MVGLAQHIGFANCVKAQKPRKGGKDFGDEQILNAMKIRRIKFIELHTASNRRDWRAT
jgi:hypothetical protein